MQGRQLSAHPADRSAAPEPDPRLRLAPMLEAQLAVRRPPLVPELAFWLVADEVDLDARCESLAAGEPPFWAFCWGAGQALARHLLDHPACVAGKRVLDLGSGCGVVAIAAARAGAAHVTAVDWDPRARAAIQLNAALNAVAVDIAERAPEYRELVLASDVLYDAEATRWLQSAAHNGCEVLLADPHRPGAARLESEPFLCAKARAFPDVDYPVATAFLYCLGPTPPP